VECVTQLIIQYDDVFCVTGCIHYFDIKLSDGISYEYKTRRLSITKSMQPLHELFDIAVEISEKHR